MDSTFWGIYCPVLGALISWTVLLETAGFVIRHFAYKRQQKFQKELEAKIASGEMPNVPLFDPMMDPMGLYSSYPKRTTASGARGDTGQYL